MREKEEDERQKCRRRKGRNKGRGRLRRVMEEGGSGKGGVREKGSREE